MRKEGWGLALLAGMAGPACLAGLLLPVSARAQTAQDTAKADAQYTAALALVEAKKYADAAPLLEKALQDFPKHPKQPLARLRLGDVYLELKFPDRAVKSYDAALADNLPPDLKSECLWGLGKARIAQKDDAKAAVSLQGAFDLTRQDPVLGPLISISLGETLTRLGRYPEAVAALERVTQWPSHADFPRSRFLIGEAYRQAGKPIEAAITFRDAATQFWRLPVAPELALAAADAFLEAGRLSDSEQEFRRVLRDYLETASAPRAQLGLGRVAFAAGKFGAARSAYQAAVVLFAASGIGPEANLRIADTYLAEKNWAEARQRYQKLVISAPRPLALEAQYSLALSFIREPQLTSAAKELDKLTSDTDSGRWGQLARLRSAEIRAGAGESEAAIALVRPVAAGAADADVRDEASYTLAELLFRKNDLPGAEAELNGLLKRAPNGPQSGNATVLLATSRVEQKDAAGAIERLAPLLAKDLEPNLHASALLALGRAQLLAKSAEGVVSLRAVLDKHPDAPAAPNAARALLAYFREAKQDGPALEMEQILATRYGGAPGGVALEDVLLEQADRQMLAGGMDEAAKLYAQVLDRKPERLKRLRARAGMAEIAAAKGKSVEVDALVAEIVKDAPAPAFLARTEYRLAKAYRKANQPAAAAAAYRAAAAAASDEETTPAVLLELAQLLAAGPKAAEAEAPLRELIAKYARSPLMPQALYALAWCHLDAGRADAARPVLVRLATEYPKSPLALDASFRLGEREYAARNWSAAAERYRAAAEGASPVADAALYKLGWALRQAGDHPGAAKAFLAAIERSPKSELVSECRVRAGEELLGCEKESEALTQFEAVLGKEATSPEERALKLQATVGAADAHLMQGDAEKARALAEPASLPANGYYGGRAYLIKADAIGVKDGPKAALAEFVRAAALFGRFKELAAEAHFRAGECQDKLGNAGAARAAWQRVVDLYAGTEWARRSQERLSGASATAGKPGA